MFSGRNVTESPELLEFILSHIYSLSLIIEFKSRINNLHPKMKADTLQRGHKQLSSTRCNLITLDRSEAAIVC